MICVLPHDIMVEDYIAIKYAQAVQKHNSTIHQLHEYKHILKIAVKYRFESSKNTSSCHTFFNVFLSTERKPKV